MKKDYVPRKCYSCSGWTLHKIDFIEEGVNFTCSHCQNVVLREGPEKKIRSEISNIRKLFPAMSNSIPELQSLQQPGDRVAFESPDAE